MEDLQSIAGYIERDSDFYARAVIDSIVSVAESIPENPELGRLVPEVGFRHIRERFVYSYRLIYRIASDDILVVAVIHGSHLLGSHVTRLTTDTNV